MSIVQSPTETEGKKRPEWGGGGGGGGEREREKSNAKTLFYKDCSLGSVKKPVQQLVLAKLLMKRHQITGIIYIHTGMNE